MLPSNVRASIAAGEQVGSGLSFKEVTEAYTTDQLSKPGNRRNRNVGALPTELRAVSDPAGLEPATTRLRGEVSDLYTTGETVSRGTNGRGPHPQEVTPSFTIGTFKIVRTALNGKGKTEDHTRPLRRDTVVLSHVLTEPVLRWQWSVVGGYDHGTYLAGFQTEADAMDYGRAMGWR